MTLTAQTCATSLMRFLPTAEAPPRSHEIQLRSPPPRDPRDRPVDVDTPYARPPSPANAFLDGADEEGARPRSRATRCSRGTCWRSGARGPRMKNARRRPRGSTPPRRPASSARTTEQPSSHASTGAAQSDLHLGWDRLRMTLPRKLVQAASCLLLALPVVALPLPRPVCRRTQRRAGGG